MISRAMILLMTSQAIFLVSGFLIHAFLARLLGVIDYGTFGVVMSILCIAQLFVITGIPEVIQKFGGAQIEAMQKLIKKTLYWQICYTSFVFALFWIIAPYLAKGFGDESLAFLFRIAGIDIVFYGLYKYFLAVQNGLHRFGKYTILGILYSIAKLLAIAILVWMGYSVVGAVIGNMIGSIIVLFLAVFFSKAAKSNEKLDKIPYFSFVTQNIFYFVGLNLFFVIDIWFVKYYLSDQNVGLYVSAANLAKSTYFFSIALSAILLPALSRSIKLKEYSRIKEITQDSLRYLVIFLFLINIVISTNPQGIITLVFGENYKDAASILIILTAGLSLISLTAVINTIMIAQGKMKACFIMIVGLLFIDFIAALILVPSYKLLGAAVATTIVGLVGTIWGGFYILEEIKSLIFSITTVRVIGTTVFILVLSVLINYNGNGVIIKASVVSGMYLFLLWLTKELSAIDLRRLKESVGIS